MVYQNFFQISLEEYSTIQENALAMLRGGTGEGGSQMKTYKTV